MAQTPEEIYMRDKNYFTNEELIKTYQQEINICYSNFAAMNGLEQDMKVQLKSAMKLHKLEALLKIASDDTFMDNKENIPDC